MEQHCSGYAEIKAFNRRRFLLVLHKLIHHWRGDALRRCTAKGTNRTYHNTVQAMTTSSNREPINPLGPELLLLVYLVSSALVLWCILRCLLHIIVHF